MLPIIADFGYDDSVVIEDGFFIHPRSAMPPGESVWAWCPACDVMRHYRSDACPGCGILG